MSQPSPDTAARRRQVEDSLGAHGLRRRWRRPAPDADDALRRLRATLTELGPVFSAFGAYLGTRPDLLPAAHCLHLAALPDRGPALETALVRQCVEAQLGAPVDGLFADFEAEPLESRRFVQTHRARLHRGDGVLVTLVRPGARQWLEHDAACLPLLRQAAIGIGWTAASFDEALDDFRRSSLRQLDARHQLEAVEALGQDARDFDLLQVPVILRELSGGDVLTRREPPGWRLDALVAPFDTPPGADPESLRQVQMEAVDIARYLCLSWLRQALVGRAFPVEPLPQHVALVPNARIAFIDGPFASLGAETQANLRAYLKTASQDPDRACSHLLAEMQPPAAGVDLYALRLAFRQVVPFRDGGWSRKGTCDSLAEHLFVHWRLLTEHGCRPRPRALPFFRGLFTVTALARQVAPQSDALSDGLEDLQLMDGLARFGDMMAPGRVDDNLDRLAAVTLQLPKRLDSALTTLSEGQLQVRLRQEGGDSGDGRRNTAVVVAAVLALLAAVGLWLPRLHALWGFELPEAAAAAVFFAVGLVLLWAIHRLR